jgi:hypothetical protein
MGNGAGVDIYEANFNIIGGKTADERNIISGNSGDGLIIETAGTRNNIISGNYIGTDINGSSDLGNAHNGVCIKNGAWSNTIGGTLTGERNVISGNDQNGVQIQGTEDNEVIGNYIGTNANGNAALGNAFDGINVIDDCLAMVQGNSILYNKNGVSCHGTSNPDLGGGGYITQGNNNVYNNLDYDVYNDTTNTIMAEYNWWGQDPPDPGQFYGSVDYDPWLGCPAEMMLASRPSELNMLRDFRDKVLSRSQRNICIGFIMNDY